MKTILSALVALAVVAEAAALADKPNFSGEWKMNAARSKFGPVPPQSSFIRKVTHIEPLLTIVEEQQSDLGVQIVTRKYTTDGQEVSFEANGAPVKGSAVWDGDSLIVRSKVENVGLDFTDRMTLSENNRVLTSVVHIASPQGDVDVTLVFERQ